MKQLAADISKKLTIKTDKTNSDKPKSDDVTETESVETITTTTTTSESASSELTSKSDLKNDIPEPSDNSNYEETDQDSDEIIQQMASNSSANDPG